MKEIFREIVDAPGYSVSNKFNVRRDVGGRGAIAGRMRKARIGDKGYWVVMIRVDGKSKSFYVHRLVAKAFIPNPLGLPEINHKHGIRDSRDINEIEWTTHQGNAIHSFEVLGVSHRGEKNGRAKLSWKKVRQIRASTGKTHAVLAKEFNVSTGLISQIRSKTIWKEKD